MRLAVNGLPVPETQVSDVVGQPPVLMQMPWAVIAKEPELRTIPFPVAEFTVIFVTFCVVKMGVPVEGRIDKIAFVHAAEVGCCQLSEVDPAGRGPPN